MVSKTSLALTGCVADIDLPARSRNYFGTHRGIRRRRPNSVYADTTNATEWM